MNLHLKEIKAQWYSKFVINGFDSTLVVVVILIIIMIRAGSSLFFLTMGWDKPKIFGAEQASGYYIIVSSSLQPKRFPNQANLSL